MCYSGTCSYENNMGNCTVRCTLKFEDKLGISACKVGGFAGVPENNQLSTNEQIELRNKAKELNLV